MYQVSIGRIDNDNQNHAISEASLVSMTVRSVLDMFSNHNDCVVDKICYCCCCLYGNMSR